MTVSSELLTVAEAADTLRVSPQRVHQLLASGELDGPAIPLGRLRFPPNSGRVYPSSLEELVRVRAEQSRVRRGVRDRGLKPDRVGPADGAGREATRAKAAAQEMKVKLDAMRDQLRAERRRSRQLIGVAAQLLEMLKTQGADADELDGVSEGYSSALTQLLSPDAPE